MFTGIVKTIGTVREVRRKGGDLRLSIASPELPWREYAIGESISVNGACLTAATLGADAFEADVSAETLSVTTLGSLAAGGRVNLEPAMRLDERLGGHLVSGHVDCVGRVLEKRRDARSLFFRIALPAAWRRYVAAKGSICVDGVSLTVNEAAGDAFSVNIVPHTAEVTTLGSWNEGTTVNIEVDIIARYLERLLSAGDESGLSKEFLKAHGYA